MVNLTGNGFYVSGGIACYNFIDHRTDFALVIGEKKKSVITFLDGFGDSLPCAHVVYLLTQNYAYRIPFSNAYKQEIPLRLIKAGH